MNTLLQSEAPPDTSALESLVRDYELGFLMPTPNVLATILSARQQMSQLASPAISTGAVA